MSLLGRIFTILLTSLILASCTHVSPTALKAKKTNYLPLDAPIPRTNNILLIAGYYPSISITKNTQWFKPNESTIRLLPNLDLAGTTARKIMDYLNSQDYPHVQGYALSPDSELSSSSILQFNHVGNKAFEGPSATPIELTANAQIAIQSLLNTYPHTDTVMIIKSQFDFGVEQIPTTNLTCTNDGTNIKLKFTVTIIDAKSLSVLAWKNGTAQSRTPNVSLCHDLTSLTDQQITHFLKQNFLVAVAAHSTVMSDLLYGHSEESTVNHAKSSSLDGQ